MGRFRRGFPYAMSWGFESESIKGFASHQAKCLSSSVIVVIEVKAAVKSNDAWNQSLWIPPVSKKKTQAHEKEECKITANACWVQTEKKKKQTNQHIKYIPYLSSGSSLSPHWLRGELVLNWRLIAVPSFLSITISFSCGLAVIQSNVAAQQHLLVPTVFSPPVKQCQGV